MASYVFIRYYLSVSRMTQKVKAGFSRNLCRT